MKLKEYFKSTGVQKSWFAKKIGMVPSAMYQICSNRIPVPQKYWEKIVKLTDGKVTLKDLMKFPDENAKDIADKDNNREIDKQIL